MEKWYGGAGRRQDFPEGQDLGGERNLRSSETLFHWLSSVWFSRTSSNMSYLAASDWIVILTYLLGIIALGAWFGKDQHTTRDYFLGSKNIPWWGIGLSIVAAETSALTVIGVPGVAYGSNLALIQMIVGYVFARILLAVIMVPHYLRGEIYSPYQLLANKFGPPARKMVAAFFSSVKRLPQVSEFMSCAFRFN